MSERLTLVDSCVWLALAIPSHAHHDICSNWFNRQDRSGGALFCRPTQQAFLRLLTTRAVLNFYGSPPLTNEQAWTLFDEMAADPRVGYLNEPAGTMEQWRRLSSCFGVAPKTWMDSYLAAIAIAGGYRLLTTDRDFSSFADLNLVLLID